MPAPPGDALKRREALLAIGLGAAGVLAAGLAGRERTLRSEASAAELPAAARRRSVRVFYRPDYVGSAHAFETTRKARWVAESLAAVPIPGLLLSSHPPLQERDVLLAHAPSYVRAVRTGTPRELAQSQGFTWDPELWPMVLASNGGVDAAVRRAAVDGVSGALSSGLHHARREHGAGFCTFNGLAIAAMRAIARGTRRVLVLDLDAHCGGGTHSLLSRTAGVRLLDVAVNPFDRYAPAAPHTLDLVSRASEYLPTVAARLRSLEGEKFDLCLYNAGMDPHQDCPVGGLPGIDKALLGRREQLVFSWCRARGLPVAFVIAGGYLGPRMDQARLVRLHRLTLAAATAA